MRAGRAVLLEAQSSEFLLEPFEGWAGRHPPELVPCVSPPPSFSGLPQLGRSTGAEVVRARTWVMSLTLSSVNDTLKLVRIVTRFWGRHEER